MIFGATDAGDDGGGDGGQITCQTPTAVVAT
jgi:hypothetical protein